MSSLIPDNYWLMNLKMNGPDGKRASRGLSRKEHLKSLEGVFHSRLKRKGRTVLFGQRNQQLAPDLILTEE